MTRNIYSRININLNIFSSQFSRKQTLKKFATNVCNILSKFRTFVHCTPHYNWMIHLVNNYTFMETTIVMAVIIYFANVVAFYVPSLFSDLVFRRQSFALIRKSRLNFFSTKRPFRTRYHCLLLTSLQVAVMESQNIHKLNYMQLITYYLSHRDSGCLQLLFLSPEPNFQLTDRVMD